MTQAVFSSIKLEGILDSSKLKDLDREDIGNMFTNMRCPPPTVTEGASVPFQGINVSEKSHERLLIASREARYYKSVGHDLKPGIKKWGFLKDLYLQLNALEDNKNQD